MSVSLFWVLLIKFCDCAAKNLIIKVRACVAEDVVSFTDTVWPLGVVLVLLAVWLADPVPAWLACEEVSLPKFADSEL